jgi:hypothetical protein
MTTDPPKSRRRFFRFSLRTLMLVAAVLCIWLGIITNRARDRKQAVEMFRSLGGSVQYEHERPPSDPPGPEWLRQLIGDEYFFSVHTLSLSRSKVDDSSLASIKRFPRIERVNSFPMQSHRRPLGTPERFDRTPRTVPQQHAGHRRRAGTP